MEMKKKKSSAPGLDILTAKNIVIRQQRSFNFLKFPPVKHSPMPKTSLRAKRYARVAEASRRRVMVMMLQTTKV